MDRLLNAIKAHSGAQDAAAGQPRFGTVTSVDPAAATARVQLQPDGVLTGWLPVLKDAVASERQDVAACDSYAAACSVRLAG